MQAVAEARGRMSLNRALELCGMSKCAWYHTRRPRKVPPDPETVSLVRQIASRRPTYGTRRMAAQVARETGKPTNRKRMQKIYRETGWIEPRKTKNEIIRASRHRQFKPAGPRQLWETDITYVHCGVDGWCYCFNVIDCFTRQWVAHILGTSATADTAVQSVLKAVSSAGDVRGLRLRTDNGPQYGSGEFRRSMRLLGIRHEFIWNHTPEQNGHVESFHKTLKKEYIWPHEIARFQDAEEILGRAFADYNGSRIHSALGYATPDEFARGLEVGNK